MTTNTNIFDLSTIDLRELLPGILQDNPFYVDYFESVTDLWQAEVFPYIEALSNIRQTLNFETKVPQDTYLLIKNANMLGYSFLSGFLTQDNYLKLVDFITRFYEVQGTNQFGNFLGFLRAARVQIEQLWSKIGIDDYVVFKEKIFVTSDNIVDQPGQTTPGTWYPTSHYKIKYAADVSGFLDEDILNELFYSLAPIHYVLNTVEAAVEFINEPLYLDTSASRFVCEPTLVDLGLVGLTYNSGTPITYNPGTPLETLESI